MAHNLLELIPSLSELNFSQNCTLYGEWLSVLITPNPWEPTLTLGGSITISILYLLSAFPEGWKAPAWAIEANATEADVFTAEMEWWTRGFFSYYNETDELYWPDPEFVNRTIWDPKEACPAAFCRAVGYTGNADLTGIGVMISYYIEAFLATVYLIAFTFYSMSHHYDVKAGLKPAATGRPHIHRSYTGRSGGPTGRILDAFRGSLDPLLSATMIMAMAMLIAAVYTSIIKSQVHVVPPNQRDIPTGSAIYDICLSLLAASFSVFPVILVYALMRHPERTERTHRRWLRRVVLVLVWGIAAAEVYLAPRGELDYDARHAGESTFYCDQRGGPRYWAGMKAAQFLVVGVPLLWMVLTVFLLTGFRLPGVVDLPWVRAWRSVWRLLVAWINLILMWGLLAYFTVLRHKIIEASDGLDQEDQWGFGQILAVATWVPSVAEFFYVLIFGLEEGLKSHMPPGYEPARQKSGHGAPDDGIPLIPSAANIAYDPHRAPSVVSVDGSLYHGAAGVGGPAYPGGAGGVGVPQVGVPAPAPVGPVPGLGYSAAPSGSWNGDQWQKQDPWQQLQRTGW